MLNLHVDLPDRGVGLVQQKDGELSAVFYDPISGYMQARALTRKELAAIVALMLAGKEFPAEVTKALSEIAQPIVASLSKHCRPNI